MEPKAIQAKISAYIEKHPELRLATQKYVLSIMQKEGEISAAEIEAVKKGSVFGSGFGNYQYDDMGLKLEYSGKEQPEKSNKEKALELVRQKAPKGNVYKTTFQALQELGMDINSPDGVKILERISNLPSEIYQEEKIGEVLIETMTKNDLSPTFENVANVMESMGISIRTNEEEESVKEEIKKLNARLFVQNLLVYMNSTASEMYDEANQSIYGSFTKFLDFGFYADNFNKLTKCDTKTLSKHFEKWADKYEDMNPYDEDGFKAQLKQYMGIDLDEEAVLKNMEVLQNPQSKEFNKVYKEILGYNALKNANTDLIVTNLEHGFGDAAVMLMTLGYASEAKVVQAGKMLAVETSAAMGTRIAAKAATKSTKFGKMMTKLAARGARLLGPAVAGGVELGGFELAKGTLGNITTAKSGSEFIHNETMAINRSISSFGFGFFGGIWGQTAVANIQKAVTRTSERTASALAPKFAEKGSIELSEVVKTFIEKSAPTGTAKFAGFVTEVTGFAIYETAISVLENIPNFPNGMSVDDVAMILWEQFKGQGIGLGQIKFISALIMWGKGGRTAQMASMEYLTKSREFEGIKVYEIKENGKTRYSVENNKFQLECKSFDEVITSGLFMAQMDKTFDVIAKEAERLEKETELEGKVGEKANSGVLNDFNLKTIDDRRNLLKSAGFTDEEIDILQKSNVLNTIALYIKYSAEAREKIKTSKKELMDDVSANPNREETFSETAMQNIDKTIKILCSIFPDETIENNLGFADDLYREDAVSVPKKLEIMNKYSKELSELFTGIKMEGYYKSEILNNILCNNIKYGEQISFESTVELVSKIMKLYEIDDFDLRYLISNILKSNIKTQNDVDIRLEAVNNFTDKEFGDFLENLLKFKNPEDIVLCNEFYKKTIQTEKYSDLFGRIVKKHSYIWLHLDSIRAKAAIFDLVCEFDIFDQASDFIFNTYENNYSEHLEFYNYFKEIVETMDIKEPLNLKHCYEQLWSNNEFTRSVMKKYILKDNNLLNSDNANSHLTETIKRVENPAQENVLEYIYDNNLLNGNTRNYQFYIIKEDYQGKTAIKLLEKFEKNDGSNNSYIYENIISKDENPGIDKVINQLIDEEESLRDISERINSIKTDAQKQAIEKYTDNPLVKYFVHTQEDYQIEFLEAALKLDIDEKENEALSDLLKYNSISTPEMGQLAKLWIENGGKISKLKEYKSNYIYGTFDYSRIENILKTKLLTKVDPNDIPLVDSLSYIKDEVVIDRLLALDKKIPNSLYNIYTRLSASTFELDFSNAVLDFYDAVAELENINQVFSSEPGLISKVADLSYGSNIDEIRQKTVHVKQLAEKYKGQDIAPEVLYLMTFGNDALNADLAGRILESAKQYEVSTGGEATGLVDWAFFPVGEIKESNVNFANFLYSGDCKIPTVHKWRLLSNTNMSNENLITKLCKEQPNAFESIIMIAGKTQDNPDNMKLVMDLFDNGQDVFRVGTIMYDHNSGNEEFIREYFINKNPIFENGNALYILQSIYEENKNFARKAYFEKRFNYKQEEITDVLEYIDKPRDNEQFAIDLFESEKYDGITNREFIHYYNKRNANFARKAIFENTWKLEPDEIIRLMKCVKKDEQGSEAYVMMLLDNGNTIDDIISLQKDINKENESLLLEMTKQKVDANLQKTILKSIIINDPNDAGGNNGKVDPKKVERYTRLLQNPKTQAWTIEMLNEGWDIETISKLALTKQNLLTQKTETVERKPVDSSTQFFMDFGMEEKQASAIIKAISKDGVIDEELQQAAVKLINNGVASNRIGEILNSAKITGEYNPKITEDAIKIKDLNLNPLLLKSLPSLNNISGADVAAKFNPKVRKTLKAMVEALDSNTKSQLEELGFNIESISKKLDSQLVKERTDVNKPTPQGKAVSGFRSKSSITGFEKIVVDKYEPIEKVWRSEEECKKWAEEKYLSIKNHEYKSTRTGDHVDVDEINRQRTEGLKEWFDFMENENEPDIKNNPFIKIILSEYITKDLLPENSSTPPVFNKENVKQVLADAMKDGNISFEKSYNAKLNADAKKSSGAMEVEIGGRKMTWYTVPKTDSSHPDFKANAAKVRAFSDGTNWCIRTWNAEPYIQQGNIHFLVDETGLTQVCVREEGPNQIAEIQKRQQNATIPVAYIDFIQDFVSKKGLQGCEGQIEQTAKQKPEFDAQRAKLQKYAQEKNYKAILEEMGISVKVLSDGTWEISGYQSYLNGICLNDYGIKENDLLANVSVIKGDANFKDSNATSLPNLREVQGMLDFGYSDISNLKNLESINGKKIAW